MLLFFSSCLKRRTLDFFLSNINNIDVVLSATCLLSPVLAYRGFLFKIKTNSKLYIPKLPKEYDMEMYEKYIIKNRQIVNRLNVVAISSLIGYYIIMNKYHKVFTPLNCILTEDSTTTASSLNFLSNKDKNKGVLSYFTLLLIPFVSLSMFYIIPPIIKYFSPSLFNYLEKIVSSGPQWILIPLIILIFSLLLLYISELYLFILYTIDNNSVNIPNYFPRFIFNWIKEIETLSKGSSELKKWFIFTYIRIIFFHLFLLFILIYFLI